MGSPRGADDHPPRHCFGRFPAQDRHRDPSSDDRLFGGPENLAAHPRRAPLEQARRAALDEAAAAPTQGVRRPPGLRRAAATTRGAGAGTPAAGTGEASTSSPRLSSSGTEAGTSATAELQ
ncbi:unnamed protein product [Prorocentrum cordatum]|uniref:Uncharacterized protein n=1 Tax=Prorocentrum cordatum TaxID=2364126 RepID=A0ABN9XQI9_9DINO|nr:unnamed protein product [Polarella glacialis]